MSVKKRWTWLAWMVGGLFVSTALAGEVKTHFAGCQAEQTVFFSYTADHRNAIEICHTSKGYRYSYGNIDKPEIRGVNKTMSAIKMFGSMLPTFVFVHNDISYWLSADKYGDADLMVTKGDWLKGTALDSIKLETDDMGYVNRVGSMLPFDNSTKS